MGSISKATLNGKKDDLKGAIIITFNNNKTCTVGISASFTNPGISLQILVSFI